MLFDILVELEILQITYSHRLLVDLNTFEMLCILLLVDLSLAFDESKK